jgi:hypothetical protein
MVQLSLSVGEVTLDDKDFYGVREAAKKAQEKGVQVSHTTLYRLINSEEKLPESKKSLRVKPKSRDRGILVYMPDVMGIELKRQRKSSGRDAVKSVKAPYDQKLKILGENISRAKSRKDDKVVEIDKYYAYLIGEKQGWKCALTGVPLEFERGGQFFHGKWCNPNICVIDRIDSDRGYVKGNIQLLTHKMNTFKSSFTDEEVYDIGKLVYLNKLNKETT